MIGRVTGCVTWTMPGVPDRVRDTYRCAHCGRIVVVEPNVVHGGYCRLCMQPTCDERNCETCVPFERRLVEAERRAAFLRACGI